MEFKEDKIYDFYFSEKHKAHLLRLNKLGIKWLSSMPNVVKVNGIEYTEMIEHGKTPLTNHFGDLILVASGKESEMKIELFKQINQ